MLSSYSFLAPPAWPLAEVGQDPDVCERLEAFRQALRELSRQHRIVIFGADLDNLTPTGEGIDDPALAQLSYDVLAADYRCDVLPRWVPMPPETGQPRYEEECRQYRKYKKAGGR